MVVATGLYLICLECKERKPLGAYVAIKRRPGQFYDRAARVGMVAPANATGPNPEIAAAERARALRNKRWRQI